MPPKIRFNHPSLPDARFIHTFDGVSADDAAWWPYSIPEDEHKFKLSVSGRLLGFTQERDIWLRCSVRSDSTVSAFKTLAWHKESGTVSFRHQDWPLKTLWGVEQLYRFALQARKAMGFEGFDAPQIQFNFGRH